MYLGSPGLLLDPSLGIPGSNPALLGAKKTCPYCFQQLSWHALSRHIRYLVQYPDTRNSSENQKTVEYEENINVLNVFDVVTKQIVLLVTD